jgi:Raf kinase inhibitor-like YbhB/YbcL family protein
MALALTSPAFGQGEQIPKKYTCEGDNISPPLRWNGTPDGTGSFVILCHDPDAPGGIFRHWAVYDIPPDRLELKEGTGVKPCTTACGRRSMPLKCPATADPVRQKATGRTTITFA